MKGRPTGSPIRDNIVEILFHLKKGYGYDIYKAYLDLFAKVHQRSIYYHLKKGCDLNIFEIHSVKKEEGDYSWGSSVEKVYYTLGSKAVPKKSSHVKEYFEKKQKKND